jgi:hypothetical protein
MQYLFRHQRPPSNLELRTISNNLFRRRTLTTAQVSTALRPFYFLVHPDLFAMFPDEQAVNENSLKTLRAHLGQEAEQNSDKFLWFANYRVFHMFANKILSHITRVWLNL